MGQQGGCRCGAIRYEVEGKPAHSALCWCEPCRKSAGATPVGWALFPRDKVTITGTPVDHASSPGTTRQFCGTCGAGLFYLSEAVFPGQVDIQSASFDDPDAFPPTGQIQLADAPAWHAAMAGMPTFRRYPGMDD